MEVNAALPTDERKTGTGKEFSRTVPTFKVSGAFSSHMVLQRDKEIKIYGFSDKDGTVIRGEFDGETAETAVSNFSFTLTFSARPACGVGKTMRIYDERGNEAVFDDVLVGDVWLIGGQSNAELNLRFVFPEDIPKQFDCDGKYRLFMQTQAYPYTHPELCGAPQPDVVCPDWRWRLPDADASLSFSAIGFFIAKELCEKTGISVGAINMSAGGACIKELIPAELADELEYTDGANVCRSGYYNTLIHPFEGLQFKGMVFFQGESEGIWRDRAEKYDFELKRLVEDERARFGFEFPFYNVQLCSYRSEGKQYFPFLETVRIRQFDALEQIKNSYLAVSMDLGSPSDWGDFAHSPKKKPLCERITAQILAAEYGTGSLSDANSPAPVSATVRGDKVTVKFKDISDGLKSRNGKSTVNGFSFGAFDSFTDAKAKITDKDTVTVTVPGGADTEYVNYAYYSDITGGNAELVKSNGLPCPAFRIKTN